MKVLWISNVMFPDACLRTKNQIPTGGGWMSSCANAIIKQYDNIQLGVISFYNSNIFLQFEINRIQYFLIPIKDDKIYDNKIESYYKKIKTDFKPDIVHIHGTEYPHSLAYIRACGIQNTVVSIQGLVNIYAKYYLGGIQEKIIKRYITFRDLVRKDSLINQQKEMQKRGEFEKELISKIKYIIGRTSWDYSCTWAINPSLNYFKCNETLRSIFYQKKWSYDTCEPYRIFLSQSHYPIKGLHQMIKALPIILKLYPNTKVYVAGYNFLNKSIIRKNGFANYIESLMKKNNVKDKFIFLGNLKEEEMAEQYLKANVFICPSAIENSPNSVGEAQLIGTPTIASYVGGTMDMITDGVDGFLYRYEEISLLSMRVCEIFGNKDLALRLSNNSRDTAKKRHNPEINAIQLANIYKNIIDMEKYG